MSGLEAAAIAASILQIAEIGIKLSINLYNFYHKVKSADQGLRALSSDIALTCNVLQQLGSTLKQDNEAKLCSPQALSTAKDVLDECKRVFQQIDGAIRESNVASGMSRLERAVRKVAFVLKEPELDVLHGNLGSLKATMVLMLNVVMYAGQIRGRSEATALKDQQGRIKDLMLDQRENEIRIRYLEIAQARSEMEDRTITATRADSVLGNASVFTAPVHSPKAEMREYYRLIKTILSDIDACKVHLERHRYRRIRDGVWMLHMEENDTFDASLVQSLKPNFPDLIPGRNRPMPELDLSGEIARKARRVVRTMDEAEILPHRHLKGPKTKVKKDEKDPLGVEMKSLVMEWTTLDNEELR